MTGSESRQIRLPIEQVSSILQKWQRQTGAHDLPTIVWLGVQHQQALVLLPLRTSLLKETTFTQNGRTGYLRLDFYGETGAAQGVDSISEITLSLICPDASVWTGLTWEVR